MPENDYIQGLYTNLEAAYGKENLPDPATFRKRILSDEAYLKGVYSNLESAYGKDNLPDEKTFIDKVKKKEPTALPVQQDGSSSASPSSSNKEAAPQAPVSPAKQDTGFRAYTPIEQPKTKLGEIPKVQAQQQLEQNAQQVNTANQVLSEKQDLRQLENVPELPAQPAPKPVTPQSPWQEAIVDPTKELKGAKPLAFELLSNKIKDIDKQIRDAEYELEQDENDGKFGMIPKAYRTGEAYKARVQQIENLALQKYPLTQRLKQNLADNEAEIEAEIDPYLADNRWKEYTFKNNTGKLVPDANKVLQLARQHAQSKGLDPDSNYSRLVQNAIQAKISFLQVDSQIDKTKLNEDFNKAYKEKFGKTPDEKAQEALKNFAPIQEANKSYQLGSEQLNETLSKEYKPVFEQVSNSYKLKVAEIDAVSKNDPEIEGQIKLMQDQEVAKLQKQVDAGEITPDEANAYLQNEFSKKVNEQYNALKSQKYGSQYDAAYRSYLDEYNGISKKLNQRAVREQAELKAMYEQKYEKAFKEFQEKYKPTEAEKIIFRDIYKKVYGKAFGEITEAQTNAQLAKEQGWGALGAMYRSMMSNLGSGIKNMATITGIPEFEAFGKDIESANEFVPEKMTEFSDWLDASKVAKSTGGLIGSMATTMLPAAGLVTLTGGTGLTALMVGSGTSFVAETAQMKGAAWEQKFAETGSVAEADKASIEMGQAQLETMWAYALDYLPFTNVLSKATRFMKPGIGKAATMAAAGVAAEIVPETIQEFKQGAAEEAIAMYNDRSYASEFMTKEKAKETFITIAPLAILPLASQAKSSISDKITQGKIQNNITTYNADIAIAKALGADGLKQYMFDITLKENADYARIFAQTMFQGGQMDKAQFDEALQVIDRAEQNKQEAQQVGLGKGDTRIYNFIKEEIQQLKTNWALTDNPTVKKLLEGRIQEREGKLQEYVNKKKTDAVIITNENGKQYVVSYDKLNEMLDDEDFKKTVKDGTVTVSGDLSKEQKSALQAKVEITPTEQAEAAEVVTPEEEVAEAEKVAETKPVEVVENADVKKADIERRRQEELKKSPVNVFTFKKINLNGENTDVTDKQKQTIERVIKQAIDAGKSADEIVGILNGAGYVVYYPGQTGNADISLRTYLKNRIDGTEKRDINEYSKAEIHKEINAKYDAELAALEQPTEQGVEEATPNVEDWSKDVESTAKALEWLSKKKKTAATETGTKVVGDKIVEETDVNSETLGISQKISQGFTKAGEQSKIDKSPKVLGEWLINNAQTGDRIIVDEDTYWVVERKTDKRGNTEIELQQYFRNESDVFENNPSAVKLFNSKHIGTETAKLATRDASDLFESSYRNSNGDVVVQQSKYIPVSKNSKSISEAYHKAKADGSNPELVKAVEDLLGKPKVKEKVTQPIETKEVDVADLEAEPKKSPKKKVEEINNLPLTHVGGLNMRPDQAEGTYLSTEKAGNRYERQGGSKRKGKVKISKPYVTNDTGNITLRNRVLNNRIEDFTDEDFAMYEKPKEGKVTIDDLNDRGIRKLAAKTTEFLKSKGYDSIYFPETDTQEGELIVFDRNNVELEEVVTDTVNYKKGGISYKLTKYGEGKEARYTKQSGGKGNPEKPIDATEFYKQKNASDKRVARSKNAYANRGVKAQVRNNIAKNFYPQSINDAVLYYIGMGWGLTKETIQKAFKNKEGAEVKAWLKIVGNNPAEGKSDAHRMAESIANDYPGLANNEAMADDKEVANAIDDVLNSYTSIDAILDDLLAMSGDNVNDVDAVVERLERQQAEEAERLYEEEIKKEKEQAEIEDKLLKERFEAMTPEQQDELLEFLNNFEYGTEPKRQEPTRTVPNPQPSETKSGTQDDGKNQPIGEREREANRRLQEAEKELAEAKKKLADKTKSLREQQGKEAQGSIFEKPLAAGQIFEAEADLREATIQKALQPLKSIVEKANQNLEAAKANVEKARKADREQGKINFEEVEVAPSSVDKGQVGEGKETSPSLAAISEVVDLLTTAKDQEGREATKTRREASKKLKQNPEIKRIFDSIEEVNKQLEAKGLLTKEGNCP